MTMEVSVVTSRVTASPSGRSAGVAALLPAGLRFGVPYDIGIGIECTKWHPWPWIDEYNLDTFIDTVYYGGKDQGDSTLACNRTRACYYHGSCNHATYTFLQPVPIGVN